MRKLNLELAEAIYTIAVEECGARDTINDRYDYVRYAVSDDGFEYRFGGMLGFGGKILNSGDRVCITCYPEDRTPDRDAAIERANARISIL